MVRWLRGVGVALWVVAAFVGCTPKAATDHAQLKVMHETCVTAMINSTCQVMVGSAPAEVANTVVIAGVGRVDATAYRALRDAGDAMCGVAKASCEKEWDGGACKSARALWSQPSS